MGTDPITKNGEEGTVEMPEAKYDELRASLEEAERAEDLEAALEEAEAERDAAQAKVETTEPLVAALRANFAEQSSLAQEYVDDMSAGDIDRAYDGELTDLFGDTDEADEGETDVGGSGTGTAQTGSGETETELSAEDQERVAALEEQAETLESVGEDRAAETARSKIAALTGGEA